MSLPNLSSPHEAVDGPRFCTSIAKETTETARKTTSTLYPKIGKFSDFIYRRQKEAPKTRIVPLVGTVKLHGAHVDWVISRDNTIRIQSRNTLELSLKSDNYGFAAFSEPIFHVIIRLKDDMVRRYTELNPNVPVDLDHPVIISGEWCGQGVQKGMAISQLSRHFVIISIRINDAWVPETEYHNIDYEAEGIYHIRKAGCHQVDLDLDDVNSTEAAIQALVAKVEETCPYGLTRGVTGRGEGIVWKARDHIENPEMWFKYRGDSTALCHEWVGGKKKQSHTAAVTKENREHEYEFAVTVVTERRLEQGLEFLAETGVQMDKAALGTFLAWVRNDVISEEQREIEEQNLSQPRLKPAITSIAKTWYNQKLIEAPEKRKADIEEITEGMKKTPF
ncbi:MAG: hypothetical protein Q9182_000727 [Xanthomendoza sp. 2 TL-2023]